MIADKSQKQTVERLPSATYHRPRVSKKTRGIVDNQRSGYTGELIKLIQDKRHTHRTKAVMPLYEGTKNHLYIPPRAH